MRDTPIRVCCGRAQGRRARTSFGAPTRSKSSSPRDPGGAAELPSDPDGSSGTRQHERDPPRARDTGRSRVLKFEGLLPTASTTGCWSAPGAASPRSGSGLAGGSRGGFRAHRAGALHDLAARAAFERWGGELACVIVEPVAGNMGLVLPRAGFLEGLRELCDHYGALLIFDEVISGFRVAWGGAQALYGVTPDLTCLGKIIGGGLPAAAYGGRRELMQELAPVGPVYQAGTLRGSPLAMAAGPRDPAPALPRGRYEARRRARERSHGLRERPRRRIELTSAASGAFGFFFHPGRSRICRREPCGRARFRVSLPHARGRLYLALAFRVRIRVARPPPPRRRGDARGGRWLPAPRGARALREAGALARMRAAFRLRLP